MTHNYLGSIESPGGTVGIAVEESTGDVYFFDGNGEGAIFKYNAKGEPVDFSSTGTNEIENAGRPLFGQMAIDNSSGPDKGDLYVPLTESKVRIFAPSGEVVGELNENVSTEVPGAPWGAARGVSVDSHGNLYVSLFGGHVNKYAPTTSPIVNRDYVSSLAGLPEVGLLATDSEGNVYMSAFTEPATVSKYEPLQFGSLQATGTLIAEGSSVPAVDMATNELYLDAESQIQIYGANGALREKIQPEPETASTFQESRAIAVDGVTGDIYVANNEGFQQNRILEFGPAVVVPDATTGRPAVTSTTATLKGVVNPSATASQCFFEYGTSTFYGQTAPCALSPGSGSQPVEVSAELTELPPGPLYHARLVATNANGTTYGKDVTFALAVAPRLGNTWSTEVRVSVATVNTEIDPMSYETSYRVEYGTNQSYGSLAPVPDATAGSGETPRTLDEHLTGLAPNTTYHYRIAASNANGTTLGPDETFTTFAELSAPTADACPNAAYRTGYSADLPDCRAYEMVSPVEKNGADVNAQEPNEFIVAESGEAIQYPARTGIAGTHGSGYGGYTQYIARRGPNGWTSDGITPTPAVNVPLQFNIGATLVQAFSSELNQAIVSAYDLPGTTGGGPNSENLYMENTANAEVLATVSRFEGVPEGHPGRRIVFLGGSSNDLEVTTFQMSENLVPEATGTAQKVYALEHGKVKLVGIMPDGSVPAGGSALAQETAVAVSDKDTVSNDGSRILFMSPAEGAERQLYMRKDGSSTVRVSESEAPGAETASDVQLQAATPNGKDVLFSTETKLLESDPGGYGQALYLYKDGPHPESEPNLTFVARITGEVKGMSEDASHIYFITEHLESLPFKTPGEGMFVWDEGTIRQIAPEVGAGEEYAVGTREEARVSANGRYIAFMNSRVLTKNPVESFGLVRGDRDGAMYVYDDDTQKLTCVSCPPSGAAVTLGAETSVGATSSSNPGFEVHVLPNFLSRDGRYVFFNTVESLLPQDTNGVTDAYEYNTETGKLSLLSPGTGEDGTWFVEASPDGSNAFLVTRQELSRSDPDKLVDLYDARVDGGFTEPPPPAPQCAGDACQGTPSAAPSFNVASEFTGQGNPAAAPTSKPKSRSLTRAQKLKRALAACAKLRSKHKRAVCKTQAHKRYGAKSASRRKRTTHRHGR